MSRWTRLAVVAVAALVLGQLVVRDVLHGRERLEDAPAPGFTLPDTSGRLVSLEGLRGKVVAVNFWATWCGPCQEEIPDLARLYAAHRKSCFELLGVAEESGSRDDVVAAAAKLGVNYPVLLDPEGRAGDAYRIPGYPRTYLIDVRGRIRRVFEGAVDPGDLERALAPLLAETSPGC